MAWAYDKSGVLLGFGKNSYTKTHPVQAKFAALAGCADRIFLHAEIAALVKAKGQPVFRVVVRRIGKKGDFMLSKPCPVCQRALKDYGVKQVEHS